MKVMLNRKANEMGNKIDNMFNEKLCPNLAKEIKKNNFGLRLDQTDVCYLELRDIEKSKASDIMVEVQEKINKLPFVAIMYQKEEKTLYAILEEEIGKCLYAALPYARRKGYVKTNTI